MADTTIAVVPLAPFHLQGESWPSNFPRSRTQTTPSIRTSRRERSAFHYGKHHATYVTNLNGLIDGTEHADKSLEQIVLDAEPGWVVQQRRPGLEPHVLLELA